MRRALLVLGVLCLGAACARVPVVVQPPVALALRTDYYVLLPGPGALVVISDGQTQTLDRPFGAARIGRPGTIETGTATEAEVNASFGAALAAQPPRPLSFLLYFLLDSDALTPESERVVGDVVSEISRRPAPEVVVVGHTDPTGSHEHNDRLSLQRAESVRARLLARGIGISESNAFAVGRGKRELLVPTPDQVAEPRNRRVELVVR
jgi:outer membrane protein OmpA-like peptidoglycan-associated protein